MLLAPAHQVSMLPLTLTTSGVLLLSRHDGGLVCMRTGRRSLVGSKASTTRSDMSLLLDSTNGNLHGVLDVCHLSSRMTGGAATLNSAA